jgi:uncharacterized membrane protein YeaQ/YmgE (transglycosylase-associated protein family)
MDRARTDRRRDRLVPCRRRLRTAGTIILGVIGAVVGGFLAQQLGYGDISGLNLESIVIATIGAIVVILIARALRGGRRATL